MIAMREPVDDDVYSKECLEQMEAALLEYVQRYGLTGAARDALTALAQREAASDERDDDVDPRPPARAG